MEVKGYQITPGADLQGAYLHAANLNGADLYGVDLHGANLYGAKNYIDLGTDPRGHHFRAVRFPHGWQIVAGCRNFTVAEAVTHWTAAGNKDALARLAILEAHT